MVGFGPKFLFYYSQDICSQSELSKNGGCNQKSCVQKPNYMKMLAENQVKTTRRLFSSI
jgi:hypothetical protein